MTPPRRPRPVQPNSVGIYGLVISGSVMAAAGEHGSVTDVAVSVLVTVLVYWVAEAYAQVLGQGIAGDDPLTAGAVAGLLSRRWALVEASYLPLVVVLLTRLAGASTTAAIDSGLVTAALLLAAFGWIAASRRGSTMFMRLVAAVAAGCFGAVAITLKTLLH
jgi:hypothetical protein